MADKSLAYSLIFNVFGNAVSKIREISNVMGEPAQAAEKLGDAVEKSGDRQVSAFRKVKDALNEVSETITRPIKSFAALGRAAAEASEKFAHSFAGIGAIAAEGFSLKNVAQQEEFFRRLQINTGMGSDAIKELREQINGAADAYGVSHDRLMEAFGSFRANGGDIKVFGENVGSVAATMQLTGMEAENAGQMFAFLQTKMGITEPKQFLDVLSQMRQQLKGIPDGMDAFAEASMRLSAPMQALHMSGAQAALALNAVYAVAARSSGGGGRRAMTATEGWLGQLADRGYQAQLSQGLGERITDANGYVMDPRLLMQKMAAKYAQALSLPANQQVVATQRLDALFGESAARMFKSVGGEIKATGHSAIMDKVLGARGNDAEFLNKATQASDGLSGSMNRLRTAMDRASESLFAEPINIFASALNHCTGVIGDAVVGLATFIAVGQGIKWIGGAIEGFKSLGIVIPIVRMLFSGLIGVIPAVISGLTAVTLGIVELSVAMLASPITWIVAGIALVGVAAYELYQHWDSVWKAIGGAVKWVGDLIGPLFRNPFVSAIMGVIAPATALMNIPRLMGTSWTKIGEVIGEAFQAVRKLAQPVIDWITDKLGWLWNRLGQAASWVASLTHSAPPAQAPDMGSNSNGGGAPANDNSGFSLFGHGGLLGPIANLTTPSGAPTTDQMAAYFRGKGWSANAAAGIAANLFKESRNSAGAVGDQGNAYGLAQWHADRQAEFQRVYGRSMVGSTWQQQADFVDHELKNREARAGNALRGAGSAAQAGAIMSSLYERPANRGGEAMQRAQLAMRIAGGKGGASSPSMAMPGADEPVAVPTDIYSHSGATAAAPTGGALAYAGDGGQRIARASLTIKIDHKGNVSTHLEHSDDMEASLDRGRPMALRWG